MKIALVCPYDYYLPGGVQSHIRDLSKILEERGHQVKVIAPKSETYCSTENNLIQIGKSQRVKFQGTQIDISLAIGTEYQYLKDILAKENFDVIHYHTIWNPCIPLQILLLSQATNVVTFHDTPQQTLFGKLAKQILYPSISNWLLRTYVHAAIAVSVTTFAYLRPADFTQVQVIPNGVFVHQFSPGQSTPLPQYLDGKINILFLGRLEERKGIFYLLQAYTILKQSYPEIRLLIAGDGYQKTAIHRFIASADISDAIVLGLINEEEKLRYYATCDIFCSPATGGESFGIVLVEAMASCKPAVGAANPGYQTILTGQGKALLVKTQCVDDLVEKLSELINNPSFRLEMAEWGLQAAQQYDWNKIVNQIEQVYQEALLKRRQH